MYSILIDFDSFFESIRHDHLIEKMLCTYIHHQLIRMFVDFYKYVKVKFWMCGEFSSIFVYSSDLLCFFVEDIIFVL